MLASVLIIAGAAALGPVSAPAHCRFQEANQLVHRWEGACGRLFGQVPRITLKPVKAIVSGRWRKDVEPTAVWAGEMTNEGNSNDPIELELYGGGSGVLRTQYGWYAVSAFTATATLLTFDVDATRAIAPSELDREIVRRADALLSSTQVWNRADDRRCPGSATTWSIYCAMEHASIEATCGAHHRRPAMEMVRQIIEERTVGRNYEHRLMNYNNDSTTTLADVHDVFRTALARMKGPPDQPLEKAAACPPPPEPAVTALDIKIVERAQQILASADKWNKQDGQTCPAGEKTVGIFCALKQASQEIIGEFDEVSPVMREARRVVDSVATKPYGARLIDYNNDPAVSFADLQSFFRILHDRLSRRLGT
jgi:hypothetical protein